MNRPEFGACSELPDDTFEHYFRASAATDSRPSDAAKAICRGCVVLETCRQRALNMAEPIRRGVMGGATAWELRRAREWRRYELGFRDALPEGSRPDWLERPPAATAVERQVNGRESPERRRS